MKEQRFEQISNEERRRSIIKAALISLGLCTPFLLTENYAAAGLLAALSCILIVLVWNRRRRAIPEANDGKPVSSDGFWRTIESLFLGFGFLALFGSIVFLPFHLSETASADELSALGRCERELGRKRVMEHLEPLSRWDLMTLKWECHDRDEDGKAAQEQLEVL